eukprot:TRINITY_DN31814_c0_g1_i1.p1 TRINITY_DN31814_c0_g1~~TRINITY_DN31814_c0_g1_i1.p1  ORF type:complete len:311 (-),score=63.41 TRINITY_DN31814_c0_g1_i1:119-1051(-)
MGESFQQIVPELVLAHKIPKDAYTYTERDVALYALGVGACGANGSDEKELKYVYHPNGQPYIQALPTFGVLFQNDLVHKLSNIPGLLFNASLLLHGQQYLEIYRPLPTHCHIENQAFITGLHDKGKAAIVEVETVSTNKETGEILCKNRSAVYLRGAGGFSKTTKPYSYQSSSPRHKQAPVVIPDDSPSATYEDHTQQSQALLYRLSGDYNPLHADPEFAKLAGYSHPILHGLCTLGFAIRAVINCCCDGQPVHVKSILGRFLLHVFPGETLVTKMWQRHERIIYQTSVKEREKVVLIGAVQLNTIASAL